MHITGVSRVHRGGIAGVSRGVGNGGGKWRAQRPGRPVKPLRRVGQARQRAGWPAAPRRRADKRRSR